jgi:hypothetical protein
MKCDTFRRAVEAFDLDATVATFSPSIVLRSPVRDEPLEQADRWPLVRHSVSSV